MSTETAAREQATLINGVDVSALAQTVEAVKNDAEVAKFRFRASNTWLGGDHNRSTIRSFYGAGQEQRTDAEPFVLDNGEHPVLLGHDQGPNPVEHLLSALAGCMTTTTAYHAAARGIEIEAISSELEGDIDLRGFLGLSDQVRKGYSAIRVRMRVRSKATPETLRELARMSPVYDVVSRSVPVDVVIETT